MKSWLLKRNIFTHTNILEEIRPYPEFNFPKRFKRPIIKSTTESFDQVAMALDLD